MAAEPRAPEPSDDVAEALRTLSSQVEALQHEVGRLAADRPLPPAEPGWGDDGSDEPEHAWVGALESPVRDSPRVPRLLLEAIFLMAAAGLSVAADLEPVAIAAVMAGAWVIVALAEWASSAAESRREQVFVPPVQQPAAPSDPSWYVPPVEHTQIDVAGAADDPETAVTRLPPLADAEATAERRPGD